MTIIKKYVRPNLTRTSAHRRVTPLLTLTPNEWVAKRNRKKVIQNWLSPAFDLRSGDSND